jgi:hypothetical protein
MLSEADACNVVARDRVGLAIGAETNSLAPPDSGTPLPLESSSFSLRVSRPAPAAPATPPQPQKISSASVHLPCRHDRAVSLYRLSLDQKQS